MSDKEKIIIECMSTIAGRLNVPVYQQINIDSSPTLMSFLFISDEHNHLLAKIFVDILQFEPKEEYLVKIEEYLRSQFFMNL